MGFREALLQALELDVAVELGDSPEATEFRNILRRDGVKAALAWREARFGEDGESD